MSESQKTAMLASDDSSDSRVFDLQGALQRLGGDKALLSDLIEFYDQDSPRLLDRLRAGVQNGRADDIRHAAHALRGLSANFGAAALRDPLMRLEEAAEHQHLEEAPAAWDQVQKESARLRDAMSPFRRQQSAR